jgi:uncharacterized phiE125 gp8 family phage protein
MALRLQTPASTPAVTPAEAKAHMNVDIADDDALITAFIAAATLAGEGIMGRAIMPQKWALTLDSFVPPVQQFGVVSQQAYAINLQRPPVTGVDSINYADPLTGTMTLLASTEYQVDTSSDVTARVAPAYGKYWPAARAQMGAVQIIFSTGYADATKVPESIKTWIKLRVAALYENREEFATGRGIVVAEMPFVDSLLDPYRTWLL